MSFYSLIRFGVSGVRHEIGAQGAPLPTKRERRSTVFASRSRLKPALQVVFRLLSVVVLCLPLRADQSVGQSGLFTVDTRWGFSEGFGMSGFFRVDTRLSGSASEAASTTFTLDTMDAVIGSARIAGYVSDTRGVGLADATVSALQNGILRAQAEADGSGYYQLTSLRPGAYQLRAEKANYLTGLRYRINLSAGETEIQHFALEGRPSAPVVTPVDREPEQPVLIPVSSTQLKVFSDGAFMSNGSVDSTKMTVVFTHGWLSNPDKWAKAMAATMVVSGVANANLLAWDWHEAANTGFELGLALSATPRQGEWLGLALAQTLGSNYSLPIHFIGHSLGTLVNAAAANYLHERTGGAFDPLRTHVTLLDDAEAANIGGRIVTLGYTIPGLNNPLTADPSTAILAQVLSVGYVLPIPRERGWMDNYVSFAGYLHNEAVNALLVQGPTRITPLLDLLELHGYAARWYGLTITTPADSEVGHRYSFERLGFDAVFPTPSPYPAGTVFTQTDGGPELSLARLNGDDEISATLRDNLQFVGLGLQRPLDYAAGVAQFTGSAFVDLAMAFLPHTPSGTPVFTAAAGSTPAYYTESRIEETPAWSLQVRLQSSPGPFFANSSRVQSSALVAGALVSIQPARREVSARGDERGGSEQQMTGATEATPCVWIPVAIPANAAVFCFDFAFNGAQGEDMLSASIAGTNVFALESRFMPTNTTLNSGPIDVSHWAGQTVEFFFGLLAGTSTNADVTISGMRFYQVEEPALTAEVANDELLVSWPATVQGYVLESRGSLAATDQWSGVTVAPVLVGLRNVVTNAIAGESGFYRLKKP